MARDGMLDTDTFPGTCAHQGDPAGCAACGARAASVCASLEREHLAELDRIARPVVLTPGATLVREGDPADHLFNVTSGSIRVFKLLPDGRRQITGFLFAGDFLGLGAGRHYSFSAEAVEAASACRFRRDDYRALLRERPALEAALLDRTCHALEAAQSQMLLLGRKTARERIGSFLLDLGERQGVGEGGAGRVRLPMTRTEVADYLGLTIETVSRELTRLKTSGAIRLISAKELQILQPDRLRAIADGEA